MAVTLPKFGLVAASETTQFKNLGKELREMGVSIESILESFDYNGADPNLVLSRVAALESWRTTAQAQIAALEAAQESNVQLDTTNSVKRMTTQYGIGRIAGTINRTITKIVTFPKPFASIPVLTANYIGARNSGAWNPAGLVDLAPPVTGKPLSPSLTNFNMMIRRTDGNNLNTGWDMYFTWTAVGELA